MRRANAPAVEDVVAGRRHLRAAYRLAGRARNPCRQRLALNSIATLVFSGARFVDVEEFILGSCAFDIEALADGATCDRDVHAAEPGAVVSAFDDGAARERTARSVALKGLAAMFRHMMDLRARGAGLRRRADF